MKTEKFPAVLEARKVVSKQMTFYRSMMGGQVMEKPKLVSSKPLSRHGATPIKRGRVVQNARAKLAA